MKPREWPLCLACGAPLPRRIEQTGIHHPTCPWNYYITCMKCGYQNNLSKLLGFWAGCSDECVKYRELPESLQKEVRRKYVDGDR